MPRPCRLADKPKNRISKFGGAVGEKCRMMSLSCVGDAAMSDKMRTAINLFLSGLVLVAFAWLYGAELKKAWQGKTSPTDPINDRVAYAATAVAGVVAAIVAAALALPAPSNGGGNGPAPAAKPSVVARMAESVGGTAPAGDKWKKWLAIAYIAAYVIIGGLALIVWVRYDASSLIKAQALTFLGLILAAAKASVP